MPSHDDELKTNVQNTCHNFALTTRENRPINFLPKTKKNADEQRDFRQRYSQPGQPGVLHLRNLLLPADSQDDGPRSPHDIPQANEQGGHQRRRRPVRHGSSPPSQRRTHEKGVPERPREHPGVPVPQLRLPVDAANFHTRSCCLLRLFGGQGFAFVRLRRVRGAPTRASNLLRDRFHNQWVLGGAHGHLRFHRRLLEKITAHARAPSLSVFTGIAVRINKTR